MDDNYKKNMASYLFLFFLFLIIILLNYPFSVFPIGRDQGIFLTMGMSVLDGNAFYKDLLTHDFPGIGFVYASIMYFIADPYLVIAVISALNSIFILSGIYFLVKYCFDNKTAMFSIIFSGLYYTLRQSWWTIAQKDILCLGFIIWGSYFFIKFAPQKQIASFYCLISGILFGIAVIIKPTFILSFVILPLYLVFYVRYTQNVSVNLREPYLFKFIIKRLAFFYFGGSIVAISLLFYLLNNDALSLFIKISSIFTPAYSAIGNKPFYHIMVSLFNPSQLIGKIILCLILLSVYTAIFCKQYPKLPFVKLSVPALICLSSYFIQRKGWGYHLDPFLFLLLMIFSCLVYNSWHHSIIFRSCLKTILIIKRYGLFFLLIIFVLYFSIISGYSTRLLHVCFGFVSREDYLNDCYSYDSSYPHPLIIENVSRWISENSSSNDKILVWGTECQIYVLSRRMYATQAPFDFLLTADLGNNVITLQKELRNEFLKRIISERPLFIIVVKNDQNPVEISSSAQDLKKIPDLLDFLNEEYTLVKSKDKLDILMLNSRLNTL